MISCKTSQGKGGAGSAQLCTIGTGWRSEVDLFAQLTTHSRLNDKVPDGSASFQADFGRFPHARGCTVCLDHVQELVGDCGFCQNRRLCFLCFLILSMVVHGALNFSEHISGTGISQKRGTPFIPQIDWNPLKGTPPPPPTTHVRQFRALETGVSGSWRDTDLSRALVASNIPPEPHLGLRWAGWGLTGLRGKKLRFRV